MGRIAETAHTRAQEGAMFGSQTSFFRSQIELQKEVILGPYKFDVGDAQSAIKGVVLGVQNGAHFGGPKWGRFWSQFKLIFQADLS